MLEAHKSSWFESLFAIYNRNLFRRRFDSLRVSGIANLTQRNSKFPLILYANHSSWWDGLMAFEIGRAAQLDHFIMMEEKQLKKLFLFRRLGAFSVIREKPREAFKSINYAVDLLKEKENRALWIFPQGEILPNDIRPLKFYNGLSKIIEKTGSCFVAPVAMRYEFLGNYKPTAFARIGALEFIEGELPLKKLTQQFAEKLAAELDTLKNDIFFNKTEYYQNLLKRPMFR